MDATGWVAVIAAFGGVGGLAQLVKLRAEKRHLAAQARASDGDLATRLHTTAREWVDYIDTKFRAVSDELAEHKRSVAARAATQAALIKEHEAWDRLIKRRVEDATGEPVPDPPPLHLDQLEEP